MSNTHKKNSVLLAKVNFPLYSVQMITSRHVLVAGGGGTANTGVKNGCVIYEISHDENTFIAEEIKRQETSNSVMNCACHNDGKRISFLVGQDDYCQHYNVSMKLVTSETMESKNNEEEKKEENLRRRRKSSSKTEENRVDSNSNDYKDIDFVFSSGDTVKTDFGTNDPMQRVVRFSNSGHRVATGGTDGFIRVWSFPSFRKLNDIQAHNKEIDDLDFSPDDKWIVSISKDATAALWDCESGKKDKDLKWDSGNKKYLYKRCRFSMIEGSRSKCRLFMLSNPASRSKTSSYLQNWNPYEGKLMNTWASDEILSALAVSEDGNFVAVGTMFTGSIYIFVSFSLQKVLHVPEAHKMFITGISFLPNSTECSAIKGSNTEAAVVSISVDNQVCIHSIKERPSISSTVAILLIIIILLITFTLCSFFGL